MATAELSSSERARSWAWSEACTPGNQDTISSCFLATRSRCCSTACDTTSILRVNRLRVWPTEATCFVAKFCIKKLKPSTNSSIVSSPESSRSNASQVVCKSRRFKSTPCAANAESMEGCVIKCMNSSLLSWPFLSVSTFKNSEQRKATKRCLRTSCKTTSSVAASACPSIMISEATAVNKLNNVHDTHMMNATKKNRQNTESWIIGPAILAQLSMVVNWNKVNSVVGTVENKLWASCSICDWSPPNTSPWPTNCVMMMLNTKHSTKTRLRIHTKVLTILRSSPAKA
mmetsp:Transcript_127777/g.367832  ORF Transcript_127777/g.367832 Transcript_127777/m.367832 type:complete len:287 (+) Transcript_127777:89-949(+)